MNKLRIIMAFCLLSVATPLLALDEIRSISIQGNKQIEENAIENVLLNKKGYVLSQKLVARDIQALYQTGYFEFVSVLYDADKGELVIEVQEKPTVVRVLIQGNDREKEKDLIKQVEVKPYTFLNVQRIQEDIERLKQYYNAKGFYLSYINYRLIEKKNQQVELVYEIQENKKILVQQINFVGNETFDDKHLKAAIQTKEKSFLSFINRAGTYYKEMVDIDRQVLIEYYGSKGYINAKVQAPKIELLPDKQSLYVTFFIDEGLPYTFSGYDFKGELLYKDEVLSDKIDMKPGDLASITKIRKDLQAVTSLYADQGYAYANVVPQFERNDDDRTAFIHYEITPGELISIGTIRIQGNESNRDKIFLREMELFPGDLYSAKGIRQSKQKIERLALFESVNISTPQTNNPKVVDIVIDVTERQTGSFNIGAGFNTLESFQIIGSLEKRSLFGYGVDVSLRAQVGRITQIFDATYRDPYFLDSKWGMSARVFNIGRRFTDFTQVSTGFSLGFDYPLYMEGLKRLRAGATYRLVNEDLSDLRPTVENLFQDGVTSSTTFNITYDSRNSVFLPTDGQLFQLTQEFAGRFMGGDNDFSKSEFDARLFLPVGDKATWPIFKKSVLAFHLNAGYVAPLTDGSRVPLFERYFPGGVFTLRGFPLRSLGPRINVASSNDLGNFSTSEFVVGGNKQLIFNTEYIMPLVLSAKIYGVFFFDMGNAFDNGETIWTLTGQRQSAGFELRWYSPLSPAPFRFAWGYPLDRKDDEHTVQFDFTFGTVF